jgi:hypothetical protein
MEDIGGVNSCREDPAGQREDDMNITPERVAAWLGMVGAGFC